MMHLVTYDLHSPSQNYEPLIRAITSFPCVKLTESCWVIRSNLTAIQIQEKLQPFIDSDDALFICAFHHYAQSGLPRWTSHWLTN